MLLFCYNVFGDYMYIFRLTRGMYLKKEIVKYCSENNINSGIIGACVGCCYEVNFRLAGGKTFYHNVGDYEIVSMTGTISKDGVHLHVSFSDVDGNVIGGHLSDGCLINTTCEVCILEDDKYLLTREFDDETGYKELVVKLK